MQKGLELMDKAHGDPDLIGILRQANAYFEVVEKRVPTYFLAYQQHSDLFIHQLMDGASGRSTGVTETTDVNEALARAKADYEAAVRYAHSPEERSSAELDLAFISSDWRGMPARIERFADERGCSEPSWYVNVALPFGFAQKVLPRALEFAVCDPLSSSTWRQAARSQLWAGDPAAALQTTRKGLQQAPGEWLGMQMISDLVALGQFQQAETEIAERLQVDSDVLYGRLMIAAAQGDQASADRLLTQYQQDADANDFDRVSYNAWIGDREGANRAAAAIDAHAYGSPDLFTVLLWCMCGAPWDLSATPKFAADIEASGLSWPPVSPIHFPLKDW